MNKIITLSAAALLFSVSSFAGGKLYGKKFKANNPISTSELSSKMGDQLKLADVVMAGEITEVCQAEGCWVRMKNEGGKDIFVKFKEGTFVIPKDLAGHKATVYGTASKKTVSVAQQKHFAEDAGKSDEEIAKITEPKEELRVDATGIIVE
jgi:hypothetical protein